MHAARESRGGRYVGIVASVLLLAGLLVVWVRPAASQGMMVDAARLPRLTTLYFPQTGHHLSNRNGFLDFWRANGQVPIFGYPVTEEIVEQGRIVQYFERARFEYHPALLGQPGQVQLGLLGRELFAGAVRPQFEAAAVRVEGDRFFAETSQAIEGEFQRFWGRRGALTLFGYPISPPLDEDGQLVQYFERGRFRANPGDMDAFYRQMEQVNGINLDTLYEVQLDDVGRQVALQRGLNMSPAPRLAGAQEWSPGLWERQIVVDLSDQWLSAYEGDLLVYRAPVATGRDGFDTPTGTYTIYYRLPVQTMTGSLGGESWYVPNVPWVQYVVGGVALHGTYWHDLHGTGARPSHGCINLRMVDAQWLYQWAGLGTTVTIQS